MKTVKKIEKYLSKLKGDWKDTSPHYDPQTDNVYLHIRDNTRSDGWTIFHIGITSQGREERTMIMRKSENLIIRINDNIDLQKRVEEGLKLFHVRNGYYQFTPQEWLNFINL